MTIQVLLLMLSLALPGDTVKLTNSINCTGYTITVPEGVTLYSDNRALLYSTTLSQVNGEKPLIQTGGPNVTISGLRLRGATGEITDFDYSRGVSKGIHGNHPGLKVINCEIFWFDMWGIYLKVPDKAFITNNYIHNCRNAGYGYGVWVGGSGSKYEGTAVISNNIFDACRSAVDGSGHYSNMIIEYNTFLPEQHYTVISRHGQSNGCKGGNSTIITNNTICSYQRAFTIPEPATDTGLILIANNKVRNNSKSVFGCNGIVPDADTWSNEYNVSITGLPTIKVNNPITLTASGADTYWWRFGDGLIDQGQRIAKSVTYTYKKPGVYIITCIGWKGLNPTINYYPVTVLPESGTWLNLWVKDSYSGSLKNKFIKTVYINNNAVWTDDVAGYEGWQQISIQCDTIKTIAFELRSPKGCKQSEIQELFSWWDAVSIVTPQGVVFHDSFENKVTWKLTTDTINTGVSTQTPVGERRDGETCYLLRYALGKDAGAGWGGKMEYKIK